MVFYESTQILPEPRTLGSGRKMFGELSKTLKDFFSGSVVCYLSTLSRTWLRSKNWLASHDPLSASLRYPCHRWPYPFDVPIKLYPIILLVCSERLVSILSSLCGCTSSALSSQQVYQQLNNLNPSQNTPYTRIYLVRAIILKVWQNRSLMARSENSLLRMLM